MDAPLFISLGYGRTPIGSGDERRLASPCNIFAKATSDVKAPGAGRPGAKVEVSLIARSRRPSDRIEMVDFEQQTAVHRLERPMLGVRRPAGVGVGRETLAPSPFLFVADDQIAGDEIDLLPVIPSYRRRDRSAAAACACPGCSPRRARPAASSA
jgi:hypothetical protein